MLDFPADALAQLKQTIMLERCRTWAHYDKLRQEIIEAASCIFRTYK